MIRIISNYQKISNISPTDDQVDSPNGFDGNGIGFKAKLIGMEHILADRDEKECLEAFNRLKASVRVHGEHKQKIQLNLGINGIQLIDELTKVELVRHEIRRIPFVILDPRDPRAFGYVYHTMDERYQFWAIKTERFAQTVVYAIKDVFDEVYKVNEESDETQKQEDQITSTTISVDPMTDESESSSLNMFSTFESQPSTTSIPLFDDTWGGNTFATVPQLSKQSSTGNTDPWGFSVPAPPVTQSSPRVDSPVNIVTLPPPMISSTRRQTVTQQSTSTDSNNTSIESIQQMYSQDSSSATKLFDDFSTFGDFLSTTSTTDDSFFSPPSAGNLFE